MLNTFGYVAKRSIRLSSLLIFALFIELFAGALAHAGFWDFLSSKPEPASKSAKPEWTASRERIEEVTAQVLVASRSTGFADPCLSISGSVLLVTLKNQTLYLCNGGRSEKNFDVSIGAGGAGKTTVGDRKTPVGIYDVHVHQSPGYGEVLYVEYPNAEQIANGYRDASGRQRKYSGSQILIHGPSYDMNRDLSVLEQYLSSTLGKAGKDLFERASMRLRSEGLESVNWTAGCVAVPSRADLQDVVRFASLPERKNMKLVIVEP
jgi:hypothetical protein